MENTDKTTEKPCTIHNVVCSCGIDFTPKEYYSGDKCFLCADSPQEVLKQNRIKDMSSKELKQYKKQMLEDEYCYNLIRLSHY